MNQKNPGVEREKYTYADLKKDLDNLSAEQLSQDVGVSREEEGFRIGGLHIKDEDLYWDHSDCVGNLEQVKADNPDDWEDVLEDYTLIPKGTVVLMEDF